MKTLFLSVLIYSVLITLIFVLNKNLQNKIDDKVLIFISVLLSLIVYICCMVNGYIVN